MSAKWASLVAANQRVREREARHRECACTRAVVAWQQWSQVQKQRRRQQEQQVQILNAQARTERERENERGERGGGRGGTHVENLSLEPLRSVVCFYGG